MAFQLIINLGDDMNLGVAGIPANPIIAFGMLETAKIAIQKNYDAQQNRVQVAPPGLVLPKV